MLKHTPPSDYCRLCVKSCIDDQRSLYDESGQANANHDLVGRYFTNAMLNMEWEQRLQYICGKCWLHIWEFHHFQESIMEVQKGLHLPIEAAKEVEKVVKIKTELNINQLEEQPKFHNSQEFSSGTGDFITPTVLTFDIKSEEPLDLNSDYEGMSPQDSQGLISSRNETSYLMNDDDSDEDFSSSDDLPLSSFRQTNLLSSDIEVPATKTSAEEFDELVALWRSSLECEICHELVASYSQLEEHFRKQHASENCYLKCCQLALQTRNDIGNHIDYHNAPQQLRCDACRKAYRSKKYLSMHKTNVHTSRGKNKNARDSQKRVKRKYRCRLCSKDFATEKHLHNHNRVVHKTKIFECYICEKSFMRPGILRNHLAYHKGEKTYPCSFCAKAFAWRSTFCRHMRKSHPQEWSKTPREREMKGYRQETRGENMVYVCTYCYKEYEKRGSMRHHVRHCHEDHEHHIPIEPEKGCRREIRGESQVFVCIYCSKEYERGESMNAHLSLCHGDKGFLPKTKKGYRRETRGENKIYVCMLCFKEYDKYTSISAHLKRFHGDDGSLAKPKKGYRLETRGEKKVFVCIFCSKEYEHQSPMINHLKRFHKDQGSLAKPKKGYRLETRGEKKFHVCIFCSKQYEHRSSMIYHLQRFHRDQDSLAKQASINSEPTMPAQNGQQPIHSRRIMGSKTTDVTNITPNGDTTSKVGDGEEASLMASLEGKELKDEKATRAYMKTEQFAAEIHALGNEQIDATDIPTEFEEATWESEEFIKSEAEEFIEL